MYFHDTWTDIGYSSEVLLCTSCTFLGDPEVKIIDLEIFQILNVNVFFFFVFFFKVFKIYVSMLP